MSGHRAQSPVLLTAAALLSAGAVIGGLSGCGAMVVAGATYGAAVAYDRRSADVVIDDELIELRARDAYLKNPEISERSRLRVTSYNYRALVTGQAQTAQIADRFARLAAQLPKVKAVYNEAEVGPVLGVAQIGKDTMLASRAKVAIQSVDLPGFDALRVKVVAENGVVYLLGLVTPEEGDATAEKVRRIPGVKRVVKIFEYIEPERPSSHTDPDTDTA
jgi:osmotically-inducible protein OsmY